MTSNQSHLAAGTVFLFFLHYCVLYCIIFSKGQPPIKLLCIGDGNVSDEYGNDFVTISDDEGNEFELEHLDTIERGGKIYMAFLTADIDEDDEDYGIIILQVVSKDGEEVLATLDDDDELNEIYGCFIERLADDFDEEEI